MATYLSLVMLYLIRVPTILQTALIFLPRYTQDSIVHPFSKTLTSSENNTLQVKADKPAQLRIAKCTSCRPLQKSIFTRVRQDRSGSALVDMLAAHAYAFTWGYRYGGACGDSYHREDHMKMVSFLGLEDELPFECEKVETGCVMRGSQHLNCLRKPMNQHMSTEWKAFIQEKVFRKIRDVDEANFTIAVHVRRGDVDPCNFPTRYLPNQHYIDLIAQFYRPGAMVKIFSENNAYLYEPLDVFNDPMRNFNLLLNESREATWKGMLTADVLIISRSGFSAVPGMITKGKVISSGGVNLPNITLVDASIMSRSVYLDLLPTVCLDRVTVRSREIGRNRRDCQIYRPSFVQFFWRKQVIACKKSLQANWLHSKNLNAFKIHSTFTIKKTCN